MIAPPKKAVAPPKKPLRRPTVVCVCSLLYIQCDTVHLYRSSVAPWWCVDLVTNGEVSVAVGQVCIHCIDWVRSLLEYWLFAHQCLILQEHIFSGGNTLIFYLSKSKSSLSIPQYRNTLLQVKLQNSEFTWVKVQKYWHPNVLKVPKVEVLKCLKIADLQAHNASHRDALWACRSAIFK